MSLLNYRTNAMQNRREVGRGSIDTDQHKHALLASTIKENEWSTWRHGAL